MKNMQRSKGFVLGILMLLVLSLTMGGCATFKRLSTEEKIVAAYITAGESMTAIHSSWKDLRSSGKVNDEQNAKFNDLFAKAQKSYKIMGDSEILILTSIDKVQKKEYVAIFNEAASRLPEILLDINTLIASIKGGK